MRLKDLKTLSYRLLFYQICTRPGLKTIDNAIVGVEQQLDQVLLHDDSVSLGKFLRKTAARGFQTLGANSSHSLSSELTRVSGQLENFRCSMCAAAGSMNHVCNGHFEKDDLVISSSGQCVETIHEMFNDYLEFSRKTYQDSGNATCNNVSVTVHIYDSQETKPDFITNLFVWPKTLLTRTRHHQSRVEIRINSESFTLYGYQSLPYVMLHECFVHAFQCSDVQDMLSTGSERHDNYADGWMDWVARESITRDLENAEKRAKKLRFPPNFNTMNEVASVRLSSRREVTEHYGIGAETARRSLILFEAFSEDPWADFLRLSIAINVAELCSDKRAELVSGLFGLLEANRAGLVAKAMAKSVRDSDIGHLLELSDKCPEILSYP